jgi:hypothetical protein
MCLRDRVVQFPWAACPDEVSVELVLLRLVKSARGAVQQTVTAQLVERVQARDGSWWYRVELSLWGMEENAAEARVCLRGGATISHAPPLPPWKSRGLGHGALPSCAWLRV